MPILIYRGRNLRIERGAVQVRSADPPKFKQCEQKS